MSENTEPLQGQYPFCDAKRSNTADTRYVRHWRDRSRYLTHAGPGQVLAAIYEYNRGVLGNFIILSVPIIALSCIIGIWFSWIRLNQFCLTSGALGIVLVLHFIDFVFPESQQSVAAQSTHKKSKNASVVAFWKFVAGLRSTFRAIAFPLAGLAIIADLIPLVVEYLRLMRPQGPAGVPTLLAFAGMATGTMGTALSYISKTSGRRWKAVQGVALLLGWGVPLASLILLVDYLHYGLPPYGLLVLVPFAASCFVIAPLLSLILLVILRKRGERCNTAARISVEGLAWSYAVAASAMLLCQFGSWYSDLCRKQARTVEEFTRPLSLMDRALSEIPDKEKAKLATRTLESIDEIESSMSRLRTLNNMSTEDNYTNTPFRGVLAMVQNLMTSGDWWGANSELYRSSSSSGRIEQWGPLTTVKPLLFNNTLASFHNCARLDQADAVEKQILRGLLANVCAKQLMEKAVSSESSDTNREYRTVEYEVRALISNTILSRLFEGSEPDSLRKGFLDPALICAADQEGLRESDHSSASKLVRSLLANSGITRLTVKKHLDSLSAAGEEGGKWPEKHFLAALFQSGGAARSLKWTHDQILSRVFGPKPDLAAESAKDALLHAFIVCTDAGNDGDALKLRAFLTAMETGGFAAQREASGERLDLGGAAWASLLAASDLDLAIQAAGIEVTEQPSADHDSNAGGLQGFAISSDLPRVLLFDLCKAANAEDQWESRYRGKRANLCDRKDSMVVDAMYRAQFVLASRALRPSMKAARRLRRSQALLAELFSPSVPTATVFRENVSENEYLLLDMYNWENGDADRKILLPSVLGGIAASRVSDGSPEAADVALIRIRLGDCGTIAGQQPMVDRAADASLGSKLLLLASVGLAAIVFSARFIDPNRTSLHYFYRRALSAAFLVDPAVVSTPESLVSGEAVKLSELVEEGDSEFKNPYPLLNCTLNVDVSKGNSIRERGGFPFLFSPLYVGGKFQLGGASSERTVFVRTKVFEDGSPGFTAASAMTISGGAAAPLMGRYSSWPIRLAMVIANIRLGYWIRFPYMTGDSINNFVEGVVSEEWKRIGKRRERLKLDKKAGLCGLACSGGGIRSAALNFGATQGLVRRGCWDVIDYLSSVSGGGYTATAISIFMREALPSSSGGDASNTTRVPEPFYLGRAYCLLREVNLVFSWVSRALRWCTDCVRGKVSSPLQFTGGTWDGLGAGQLGPWCYVSDGGHFENLGVYSLLQRRCALIIAVDGEADPRGYLDGLSRLLWLAEIDLGVKIEFRPDDLSGLVAPNNEGRRHFAVARINYNASSVGCEETRSVNEGWLLYMRSSLCGNEDQVIRGYKSRVPDFPHESTTDQFFSEEQFEAYRRLGEHIAASALEGLGVGPGATSVADLVMAAKSAFEKPDSASAIHAAGGASAPAPEAPAG